MIDIDFMREALIEAEKAYKIGEVPIGAIIVKDGVIVGRGHNTKETDKDPTYHGEMTAIRNAAKNLGGWRLIGCTMYVTLEPCLMCAGAIYQSRIDKVYIGTHDPKAGAVESLYNVFSDKRLNHMVDYEFGILQEDCSNILKRFFKMLRSKK